ncbi:MAG: 4Fe-4S dicluster domain-containing protein [Deltaproteobacteria bacterium]|nr:4Fe-4S dicluster domain-containing protein [Deltaproteobacteria bacterium]
MNCTPTGCPSCQPAAVAPASVASPGLAPSSATPADPGRREFVWDAIRTFSFGALTLTALPILVAEADADDDPKAAAPPADPSATVGAAKRKRTVLFGYLVDTTKCIGCGGCMLACKNENAVPDDQFRTWVERYVYYKDGRVEVDTCTSGNFSFDQKPALDPKVVDKAFFVPKLCNHCVETPCIQVCPVGASLMTKDGVVLIDHERCIGCAYCVQACPFGTRFINHKTNTADKCTWCYHRVAKGEKPACVEVCPTGTRIFGDINDPDSDISKVLAVHRIDVLKSYLGTRPKTRYIGLTSEVV